MEEIVKIFQQYPNVFPSGYFRFLKGTLREKFQNKEIIFENGVVLTWKKYKVNPGKYAKYNFKKGDIKINHLVNKNQGNGEAKKIFLQFIEKHKDKNLLIDVRTNNQRAINFYKKNGFEQVGETTFNNLPGLIYFKKVGQND